MFSKTIRERFHDRFMLSYTTGHNSPVLRGSLTHLADGGTLNRQPFGMKTVVSNMRRNATSSASEKAGAP